MFTHRCGEGDAKVLWKPELVGGEAGLVKVVGAQEEVPVLALAHVAQHGKDPVVDEPHHHAEIKENVDLSCCISSFRWGHY